MSQVDNDNKQAKQLFLKQCIKKVADTQDTRAYNSLYAHFKPLLRSYLLSLDASAEYMVDDLVQITMLKVWQKAKSFNPDKAQVCTWVFTLARHCRIDEYRRNKRHSHEVTTLPEWPEVETESIESNPLAFVENNRIETVIEKTINQLPEAQRQTMSTIYLKEMTHLETAEHLNLPLGTVKSRLRLGLKKMKPAMTKHHLIPMQEMVSA